MRLSTKAKDWLKVALASAVLASAGGYGVNYYFKHIKIYEDRQIQKQLPEKKVEEGKQPQVKQTQPTPSQTPRKSLEYGANRQALECIKAKYESDYKISTTLQFQPPSKESGGKPSIRLFSVNYSVKENRNSAPIMNLMKEVRDSLGLMLAPDDSAVFRKLGFVELSTPLELSPSLTDSLCAFFAKNSSNFIFLIKQNEQGKVVAVSVMDKKQNPLPLLLNELEAILRRFGSSLRTS